MLKLLKYMKKYWGIAILAPLFMILEVAMDMVLTQYMEKMVDYGISTSNMDNILKYGLIMIGIVILGVAGGILSGVFTNISCYKFGNDLRCDCFKKIMYLSVNQADDFKTGSLVTRVTNDITQIQNMISMCIRGLVRSVSFFVIGIIFTLSISPKFGVILIVALPIELIIMLVFMKFLFPVFSKIQARLDKVNTVVLDNVDGARVVKAFSKEEYEYNTFKKANDDYTDLNLYTGKLSALINPLFNIVVFATQIVIYAIGGKSIMEGFKKLLGPEIMLGQITQAITYITMICSALIMVGMMVAYIARAMASAKRINEVLDAKEEIVDGTFDMADIKEEDRGTIEFKNVSFSYPLSTRNVLNNINLKINKGETVAIVGSTGCGKSTLVNLLVRFYDVTDGDIFIDGVNIKDYKLKDLRYIVSICLQKAELFSGTMKENISFGCVNATDEEIYKAARISQALEFIESKENKFDEMVEEKGTSLSGGQKQRLSIARAILRNSEILIFDDSSSALDLVTESKLYKAMNEEMRDTTKIVVAQRIATAKNADKIVVLEKGTIESYGTHDELMEKSAVYRDIYMSQLKKEE